MHMIRLGFHLSIRGGVENAPATAFALGYGCFQLFVSNSRSWKSKSMENSSVLAFKKMASSSNAVAFAHMPYLCNLASPNADVYAKSKHMLADNLARCEVLGIRYLVLHLGSHLGRGYEYGATRISTALSDALPKGGNVTLLLENTSGYTNSIGSTMEEIGDIMKRVDSKNIGLCMDTCHAFAAGYDFNANGASVLAKDIAKYIGPSLLKLVHLNDAKFPAGSKRDRHWHIGRGYIGTGGFRKLFHEPLFQKGPYIMETPVNDEGDEAVNMEAAKRIISEEVRNVSFQAR